MGRRPAISASSQITDIELRKGAWTVEEDIKLMTYVTKYGCWNWRQLPKFAGLARCGKSCRLRWLNYLNPNIKRGNYSKEEENTIIRLHESVGNKWSLIAAQLPGRTDNEIKNHWHGKLKKMLKKASSFKNRPEAAGSSLVNEASTIIANVVLPDALEADNTLKYDATSCSLPEYKTVSDHFSATSSSEEIYSDISGDIWKDTVVVGRNNAYNYVYPDDEYLHFKESFAAAADYGYVSLFSFPSLSNGPHDEEDLLLPLWNA